MSPGSRFTGESKRAGRNIVQHALFMALTALMLTRPALADEATPPPTPDRLAAPPTAEHPTQADIGAQLYWQNCQPCHGDQGQGLTDDWRAQYPPEDQDCWNSGCHGTNHYTNGFLLPTQVPALIGAQTLARFSTAASLHDFIRAAMPFQAKGSLKDEEYWAITAFLLRAHGLPDSALPIADATRAARIPLGPTPTATPTPLPASTSQPSGALTSIIIAVSAGVIGLGLWRWMKRR